MNFHKFADAVSAQFDKMSNQDLFSTYASRDAVWDQYLLAFNPKDNPIYIERTEHDCQMCRQFIKHIGNVVAIDEDGTLISVWDVPNIPEPYASVALKLSEFVKSQPIAYTFFHNERKAGKQISIQELPNGDTKKWSHFYAAIPDQFYERDIATQRSKSQSRGAMHKRSLEEISLSTLDTVLDLLKENLIYRGAEHISKVENFRDIKEKYESAANKDAFVWLTFKSPGAGIRNSVIGTLLLDIEADVAPENAVKSFESKVAPANYKRPKALVTKRMLEEAIKVIDEKGIRSALSRRQALPTDVSVADVIYANRSIAMKDQDPLMDLLDSPSTVKPNTKNATEITIQDFLSNVVPKSTNINLLVTPSLAGNKVQISAPVDQDAKNILQWDNNFSWSYSGNVADSEMARNVAAKGGKINGVLRFSIQWNDNGKDNTDLDAHCQSPDGHISFSSKQQGSGSLDIDITDPSGDVAVENITWPNLSDMTDGTYEFWTHDYTGNGIKDIHSAEIAFNGEIYHYSFSSIYENQKIATVTLKNGEFTIKHHAEYTSSSSMESIPVTLIMLSPNFWGANKAGNKHYMFMTNEEQNPAPFRGYYNEFLAGNLHDIRKPLDMLSSKMMCTPVEGGLAGYGFSSSKHISVFIKADNRLYKVKV